jgi:CRP-like cAMP-binding protein
MQRTDEYKEKLRFIMEAMPSLEKASKITKDRVCRSFRLFSFPPGYTLFNEGEFIRSAYLLRTGEVELFSRRNLRLVNHIQELKSLPDMD